MISFLSPCDIVQDNPPGREYVRVRGHEYVIDLIFRCRSRIVRWDLREAEAGKDMEEAILTHPWKNRWVDAAPTRLGGT